ncbi:hypothetical protein K469DRAFT_495723, partial [Zopfia rhizophila CBS 207.26]
DILVPYEPRKTLMQYLSAFDVAKLDLSLNHVLDDSERQAYLNPIRDLIWNTSEMDALIKEGMKLILLGNDVPSLQKRLNNTRKYLKRYGHERRLQIYLVGVFPIQGKTEESFERMLRFSFDGEPSKSRIIMDKRQLYTVRRTISDNNQGLRKHFLMAFSVPAHHHNGFWYKVPNIPDTTIDLRVYIPCFYDRMCGEIRVPPLEIPRISGCIS